MDAGNSNKSAPGRPFKKGQSGNPSGRPKLDHDVRELARQYCPDAIRRLAQWMQSDHPTASVAAANTILDRGYGKAVQSVYNAPTNPAELSDAELMVIARGGGDDTAEPPLDPSQLN